MNLLPLMRSEAPVQLPENLPQAESIAEPQEVGVFDGTFDALSDILPATGLSIGSAALGAWSSLEELGRPMRQRLVGEGRDVAAEMAKEADDQAAQMRKTIREEYTPDPNATGTAAQMIYGIGTELTKAAVSTVAGMGNPSASALIYGALHGVETTQKYKDQGVDDGTATKLGIGTGIAGAVGMRLPATFGASRLQSAIFGATVNPISNVAEDTTIRTILDKADYSKLAASINPLDPVNIAIGAVVGAGFGAMGWRRRPEAAKREAATASREQTASSTAPDRAPAPEPAAAPRVRAETTSPRSALTETAEIAEAREASSLRMSEAGVVLQNRERGQASSIAQMQSIAGDPDYNRISVSRDFSSGAPAVAYVSDLPPEQLGRTEVVSASDGSKMNMRYAVVEAEDLQASNFADGTRNPEFGRVARHVTIAGNGRVAGVTEAYRRGTASKYKADLAADSAHGISRGVIESMDHPVLIRIMEDKDASRPDIAMLSNQSGTKGFSATEQAENDAATIDISRLTFDEEGGITDETIRQFVALAPDNSSLMDRSGVPNTLARPRLERAIFQRAYGNANLTSLLTDAESPGGRVVQVLLKSAPRMIQLERAGDLDFRGDLVAAVNEIYVEKAAGSVLSVRELAAQNAQGRTAETQAFLDYFATIGNNINAPTEVFRNLADWAAAQADNATGIFADETPQATRADLMMQFQDLTGVQIDPHVFDMVQQQVSRQQAHDTVRQMIRGGLEESGRFAPEQVDAQAELWSNAVMRMADQAGQDPVEILPKIRMGSGERSGGVAMPVENSVHLTPNADITTFSHEMGHWWLANAIELSKSNQTDLSLRKDVRTLLDVFGVKDQVEWDSLGIEGQRRYHEAFASWVEEFLTTGRVGDARVQSLLEKFRSWIVAIYRDFRAHLDDRYREQFGEDLPPLSDEVRDILERNLSVEDARQAAYRSFSPTHASADAARYAAYQGQIRADQPVVHANAQELTASIFEESRAADALDAREKVEVNPPVDVDRARGEQQMLKDRLGGDAAFAPKDPGVDADLPVYEIPRRPEPEPIAEESESPSWQDQLVGTLRRFFGGEDTDAGSPAPEVQPQAESRRAENINAGDEARVRAQAESILEQNPDMPVIAAPRPEDADLPSSPRTAAEVMEAAEREASEAERFANILDSAAQCVLKNGGMNA